MTQYAFTDSEVAALTDRAAQRRATNRRRQRADKSVSGSHADVVAAVAEEALRLHLGLEEVPSSNEPVGWKVGGYTIRGTTDPEASLRVYENDKGPMACVYVRKGYNLAIVVGWCDADFAKNRAYFNDRLKFPCYEVPSPHLVKF